jgi:hypothetical protein
LGIADYGFAEATQSEIASPQSEIAALRGPLAEIATNAWRLKVRMIDAETGEPKEQTARLYRFVDGLFRDGRAGIKVVDKTGKPYYEACRRRYQLEHTPGLARDEIIRHGPSHHPLWERPLCNGEIIVGCGHRGANDDSPELLSPQRTEGTQRT